MNKLLQINFNKLTKNVAQYRLRIVSINSSNDKDRQKHECLDNSLDEVDSLKNRNKHLSLLIILGDSKLVTKTEIKINRSH